MSNLSRDFRLQMDGWSETLRSPPWSSASLMSWFSSKRLPFCPNHLTLMVCVHCIQCSTSEQWFCFHEYKHIWRVHCSPNCFPGHKTVHQEVFLLESCYSLGLHVAKGCSKIIKVAVFNNSASKHPTYTYSLSALCYCDLEISPLHHHGGSSKPLNAQ